MTDRQRKVLATIAEFIGRWGYGPTVRELAEELGVSKTAAHKHLKALRAEGHIDWDDGYQRTLRITDPDA